MERRFGVFNLWGWGMYSLRRFTAVWGPCLLLLSACHSGFVVQSLNSISGSSTSSSTSPSSTAPSSNSNGGSAPSNNGNTGSPGTGSGGGNGPGSNTIATPTPAPTPAPQAAGSGNWTYDLDSAHATFGLVARGDAAFLVATPQSSPASPYAFAVYNENGQVAGYPTPVAQSDGTYKYALPTSRYGYFEIKPTEGNASSLIPALGSRPAGLLTYAVLAAPDTNPTSGFQDDFTSVQGTTLEAGANALGTGTFPWMGYTSYGVGDYSWGTCEANQATAAQDCANFLANDPDVAIFKNSNMMPLFYMSQLPLWATASTNGSAQGYPPTDMSQWQAYLDYIIPQIVSRYSFLPYRRYQITWEPNDGWGWHGTDAQMLQLYQIAYTEIHKYDSKAIILGPTITNFGPAMQTQFQRYLGMNFANYIDGVSWHPYPSLGQIFPAAQEDTWIAQFQGYINQAKGHTVPWYATESGISNYEMSLNGNLPVNSSNYNVYHALGNVGMALLEKKDGYSLHTYFYTADYSAQLGYGLFYNVTAAYSFGPNKVSPKVDVPMIRQANELLNHSNAVGQLVAPAGNTNLEVLYYQNKHTSVYTAVAWDPSGSNATLALQTGATQVVLMDAFGNAQTINTPTGVLSLPLTIEPQYVQGIGSAALSSITPATPTGN